LFPVDVKVHESVDEPEPVRLVGETVQNDVVLVARLTTPVKPFTALIVAVDVPPAFTFTLTLVGLAAIVKSWTTNVTVAECESEPLVPVEAT
jgi:hypothetical protein